MRWHAHAAVRSAAALASSNGLGSGLLARPLAPRDASSHNRPSLPHRRRSRQTTNVVSTWLCTAPPLMAKHCVVTPPSSARSHGKPCLHTSPTERTARPSMPRVDARNSGILSSWARDRSAFLCWPARWAAAGTATVRHSSASWCAPVLPERLRLCAPAPPAVGAAVGGACSASLSSKQSPPRP